MAVIQWNANRLNSLQDYSDYHEYWTSLRTKDYKLWVDEGRVAAKNDLFFLLNFVLSFGNTPERTTRLPLYFHDYFLKFCRRTEYMLRNQGGVCANARGTGKSHVITIAGSMQAALKYDNIAILILSQQAQWAKRWMSLIRQECMLNFKLQELFGQDRLWTGNHDDIVRQARAAGSDWGFGALSFKRTAPRSNATFEAGYFKEGAKTGSRFDMIFADDIEDESLVKNAEVREQCRESFEAHLSTVTPVVIQDAVIMVTNTQFHDDGIVARRAAMVKKRDPQLHMAEPAEDLTRAGNGPAGGTPCYPWDAKALHQRWEQSCQEPRGRTNYYVQYCLDYTKSSEGRFDYGSIVQYEEPVDVAAAGAYAVICIDPSGGHTSPSAGVGAIHLGHGRWRIISMMWGFFKMDALKAAWGEFFARTKALCAGVWEVRVEVIGHSTWDREAVRALQLVGMGATPVCRFTSVTMPKGDFLTGKDARLYDWLAVPIANGQIEIPIPGGAEPRLPVFDHEHRLQDGSRMILDSIGGFPTAPESSKDVLDAISLLFAPKKKLKSCGSMMDPVPAGEEDWGHEARRQSQLGESDSWMAQ